MGVRPPVFHEVDVDSKVMRWGRVVPTHSLMGVTGRTGTRPTEVKTQQNQEIMTEKINYALIRNQTMTKEQVAEALKRDLECIAALAIELSKNTPVQELLTEEYWQRYLKLKAQAEIEEALKQPN